MPIFKVCLDLLLVLFTMHFNTKCIIMATKIMITKKEDESRNMKTKKRTT